MCSSCRRGGSPDFDAPIEWLTGKWALPQLWRLLELYEWTKPEREKLLDIFFALSFLPTGDRPEGLGL